MSHLEVTLAAQLDEAGIKYEQQFKAITGRRFSFDFAVKDVCDDTWLIECQGGIWHKGGHSTGVGITRDAEKNNLAALAGYRCLMVTSEHIKSGQALTWIQEAINGPRRQSDDD